MCYVAVFDEENSSMNNNNSNRTSKSKLPCKPLSAHTDRSVITSSANLIQISDNSCTNRSSLQPKLPCKPCLAAPKDRSVITSPAGLTQNSSNNCSSVCTLPTYPMVARTSGLSTVGAPATGRGVPVTQTSSTPRGYRQPPAFLAPAAVAGHSLAPGQLPSPLVPCPQMRSPSSPASSSVSSYVSQQLVTTKPLTATAAVSSSHSTQLPVYITPMHPPNVFSRPTGFYRPAGSQPGFNARPSLPVGMAHNGVFASNAIGNQQTALPQLHLPSSCSRGSDLLSHTSTGRNDVPFKSDSSVAVASVQAGMVTNGLSPLSPPDVCMSFNGMALTDDDFSLLLDAMKEEHAAFDGCRNTPADNFPTSSDSYFVKSKNHPVEMSPAESDSSLSDWSFIERPSPPAMSSVSPNITGRQDEASVVKEVPVASLASSLLMQFSLDSKPSDASNSVCEHLSPRRIDHFRAQKPSSVSTPQPGSVSLFVLCTLCVSKLGILSVVHVYMFIYQKNGKEAVDSVGDCFAKT